MCKSRKHNQITTETKILLLLDHITETWITKHYKVWTVNSFANYCSFWSFHRKLCPVCTSEIKLSLQCSLYSSVLNRTCISCFMTVDMLIRCWRVMKLQNREWHRNRLLTPLLPCTVCLSPHPHPVSSPFSTCCPHPLPIAVRVVIVPIPTPSPHERNPCLSTVSTYRPMYSITLSTVQSVHLVAGNVTKSFTSFSGVQVSNGRVSAIIQSCQCLNGVSISRVSGLGL